MRRPEDRSAETFTVFVGREAELARLEPLLEHARLLTLTGAGGSGKSRLAIEAARRAGEVEATQTFVVELARVASNDLAAAALLAGVGGRQEPLRAPLESIASLLGAGAVRLILDNCEHVRPAIAAIVTELLDRCPKLQVLATAREPLALEGEVVWQVPGMSTPDPDASSSLVGVIQSDAGRLFVACAVAHEPSFGLTSEVAPAIGTICRELDGMPLAISLAAANVCDHSPAEVAARLADRFRLLDVEGDTTQPARHGGLRASLDWSYELLDADQQRLFRRLAVLSGATIEDATAVCAPEKSASPVGARLRSLASRGLLELRLDAPPGGPYFEMLTTVRQYARERLDQDAERDALRERHLAWFAKLASEADELLNDPVGRRLLDLQLPNLRAALDRAIESDVPLALAMSGQLAHYWFATDRFEEGRRTCARVLAVADGTDAAARALVLWCAALLAGVVEDYEQAHAHASEGLKLAEASGDERALGLCLQITNLVLGTVDPTRAAETGRRAVELLRRAGNAYDVGHALMTLAAAEALRDRFDAFAALRAEFMSIPQAREDDWLRILVDLHAAWADLTQGDPRSALAHVEGILETLGDEVSTRAALARSHRLHARARAGDAERALREGIEDLDAARAAGSAVAVLSLEQALAIVELSLGDLDACERRAVRHLDAAALHAAVLWRELLARAAAERGRPAQVAEHAAAIREIATYSGSERQSALADYLDGVAALQRGDLQDAPELLHRALRAQHEHRCRRDAADTLEALAMLALRGQDARRAARLHAASATARRALGCVRVPPERQALAELSAAVDHALGTEQAAQARAEGERLSLEEAIAYAQRSRGKRGRALQGWASLTPAETQAARLAASGSSNPEIAAALLMSRGTVKTHLSRAYGKLGVTNRTQLAALLGAIET